MKDVKKLFATVAVPAFAKIPQTMLALMQRVNVEAFDIVGTRHLTPWPESSLKDEFSRADHAALATTALIVSRYAIWNPDRSFCENGNGGWSKFIAYVEQTLRVRHKLPEQGSRYEDEWGMSLSIIDGLARVEFDVRERFGLYAYVSLATDRCVEAIRSTAWPRYPGREEHPQERADWVQRCLRTAAKLQAEWRSKKGAASAFFDAGEIEGHAAKENLTPQEDKQHGSKGRLAIAKVAPAGRASLFDGQADGATL